jgi:hypothetical protein
MEEKNPFFSSFKPWHLMGHRFLFQFFFLFLSKLDFAHLVNTRLLLIIFQNVWGKVF